MQRSRQLCWYWIHIINNDWYNDYSIYYEYFHVKYWNMIKQHRINILIIDKSRNSELTTTDTAHCKSKDFDDESQLTHYHEQQSF